MGIKLLDAPDHIPFSAYPALHARKSASLTTKNDRAVPVPRGGQSHYQANRWQRYVKTYADAQGYADYKAWPAFP